MVQLVVTASVVPQVLVSLKFDALVPPSTMLAMFRTALPVFVRVTDDAAVVVLGSVEGKVIVVAERLAIGAGELCPVPLSVTVCGEPGALSTTLR